MYGLPVLKCRKCLSNLNGATTGSLIAQALGLDEDDIGYENHQPALWNGGLEYALVPLVSIGAIQNINVDVTKLLEVEASTKVSHSNVYAYCAGGIASNAAYHARMFAHSAGIPEDPATGSAVASLCGQIARCDMGNDDKGSFLIEQGYEMGRPSQIYLDIEKSGGGIRSSGIGGGAVIMSEGKLYI